MSIDDKRMALVRDLVDSIVAKLSYSLLWEIDKKNECKKDLCRCVFDVLKSSPAAPIDAGENVRYRFVVASQLLKNVKPVLGRYSIAPDVADEDDFVNEMEEEFRAILLSHNNAMLTNWRTA